MRKRGPLVRMLNYHLDKLQGQPGKKGVRDFELMMSHKEGGFAHEQKVIAGTPLDSLYKDAV